MIVVVYVFPQPRFKLIEIVEFVQVKELGFQRAEKTFHSCIVIAISFAGHACKRPGDTPLHVATTVLAGTELALRLMAYPGLQM